jgi:hypothetical protein
MKFYLLDIRCYRLEYLKFRSGRSVGIEIVAELLQSFGGTENRRSFRSLESRFLPAGARFQPLPCRGTWFRWPDSPETNVERFFQLFRADKKRKFTAIKKASNYAGQMFRFRFQCSSRLSDRRLYRGRALLSKQHLLLS